MHAIYTLHGYAFVKSHAWQQPRNDKDGDNEPATLPRLIKAEKESEMDKIHKSNFRPEF